MLTRTTDEVVETGLYEYASASDNRSVYQIIENELFESKLSQYFTAWQNREIVINYANSVSVYGERFENIIDEMAK